MVQSQANGLSYMSGMLWSNSNNAVTAGNTQTEAPQFTEEVKQKDIVKEGFLWKQSRYMKTWKK